METLTHILNGFSVCLQPINLWYTFVGVLMGTIIGVLPKAAEFPGGVRLWVPMQGDPNVNGQSYSFDGLARLKPSVTLGQANAELVRTQQVIFDTRDKEQLEVLWSNGNAPWKM